MKPADIEALARWDVKQPVDKEIAFRTARELLQDFTGVPCVVDLAAMRDAIATLGGGPGRINPLQPVDLVIDHSVQVDEYGTEAAERLNTQLEYGHNGERYQFLRWGGAALRNFRVVPSDTGISHQVNLEYLVHREFESPILQSMLQPCSHPPFQFATTLRADYHSLSQYPTPRRHGSAPPQSRQELVQRRFGPGP